MARMRAFGSRPKNTHFDYEAREPKIKTAAARAVFSDVLQLQGRFSIGTGPKAMGHLATPMGIVVRTTGLCRQKALAGQFISPPIRLVRRPRGTIIGGRHGSCR